MSRVRTTAPSVLVSVVVLMALGGPVACAQDAGGGAERSSRLTLGFAVDTTVTPESWWGVDPALAVRAEVVRLWRDYLAVRQDSTRRVAFWSAADRERAPDPDLALASASYIADADAVLIEALPLVAGDSSRWVLRTVYTSGGTIARPGLLAMERMHVVHEGGRWVLAHPGVVETAGWRRERVGQIDYVVHPALGFDTRRAQETARWLDATAHRFGVSDARRITYYLVPDVQAALQLTGLEWAISADRSGGRANPRARIVFAADPRFGEAYLHELTHVLLAPWLGDASAFVGEGIAYWLGGARGQTFPTMMQDLATFLARQPGLELRAVLEENGSGPIGSARLPAAAAVFELAHRRGGDAAVRRLVEETRAGQPGIEAVAGALGLTPPELESDWRALVLSFGDSAGRPTSP